MIPNGKKHNLFIPIEILLVENNPGDLVLIEKNLRSGKLFNKINVVRNTIEAIKYINREVKYSTVECPDIILVNLSMPPEMEAKALKILTETEECKEIKIIVLTNNRYEEDILQKHNINYPFLRRPFEVRQLTDIILSLNSFSVTFIKRV